MSNTNSNSVLNILILMICFIVLYFILFKSTQNNKNINENFNNSINNSTNNPINNLINSPIDNPINNSMDNSIDNTSNNVLDNSLGKCKYLENDMSYINKHKKSKHKKSKHKKHRCIKNIDNINNENKINKLCTIMCEKNKINSEFLNQQYHKDYYDTITAINYLTPQKELFNLGFLPVQEMQPNMENIKQLVTLFIKKLNSEIKHNVSEYLHVNSGWNDMGKRKREKYGYEEQLEKLGLPGSLYTEPSDKAKVKLIKIDKSEQFNTDDQIRFISNIIIQKINTKDQMVIKIYFFMERDKAKCIDRSNFFEKSIDQHNDKKNILDIDLNVIIEQIFIVGFLTDDGLKKTTMDKFMDYGKIQRADGTTDQSKIIKIMQQKHCERAKELNSFLCSLDNETKEIHNVPCIGDYESYKNTRTIVDDLKHYPQYSFGDVTI